MNAEHIKALETRATWAQWLDYEHKYQRFREGEDEIYLHNLKHADMYVMNKQFCELVDHARLSMPDDTKFELNWPPTKSGFMWCETPIRCPGWIFDKSSSQFMKSALRQVPEIRFQFGNEFPEPLIDDAVGVRTSMVGIRAVGWQAVSRTTNLDDGRRFTAFDIPLKPPEVPQAYSFLCYYDFADGTFERWSYFSLTPDDTVGEKVGTFERLAQKEGGAYLKEELRFHEIRWVFAAMHLMSQHLTIHVDHDTDRATKRRAEREKKVIAPKFRVVTLRRVWLEDKDREIRERTGVAKDWNWHWTVRGHWRNQWCPSTQAHKNVFVESYIKGPLDKPLKPPAQTLFLAKR